MLIPASLPWLLREFSVARCLPTVSSVTCTSLKVWTVAVPSLVCSLCLSVSLMSPLDEALLLFHPPRPPVNLLYQPCELLELWRVLLGHALVGPAQGAHFTTVCPFREDQGFIVSTYRTGHKLLLLVPRNHRLCSGLCRHCVPTKHIQQNIMCIKIIQSE